MRAAAPATLTPAPHAANLIAGQFSKLMDATKEVKNHHEVELNAPRLIK
jgi:hypothetical protein